MKGAHGHMHSSNRRKWSNSYVVVEAKRKAEEMKTKIASLGSRKAELSAKMSEMQSTISSLREEQRAVESAFQEKQSEANLMREKYAADLRQREGEIEGLKLRLQLRSAEVGPNATMAEAKATEVTTWLVGLSAAAAEALSPSPLELCLGPKRRPLESSWRRGAGGCAVKNRRERKSTVAVKNRGAEMARVEGDGRQF